MSPPPGGAEHAHLPANPYNPLAWFLGEPEIGPGTWIGAFAVIDGSGGLVIGAGCDIGACSQIYTHSSIRRCVSGRQHNEVERSPTRIGDRVFIGPNVTILMGVTVGDEAAILAGSVVTSDVAPRTMVAGVPARPIANIDIAGASVQFLPVREQGER